MDTHDQPPARPVLKYEEILIIDPKSLLKY